ncbi:MAG: hypothetical protein ICV74_11140 [Thermoleophilia bacterium]|nr:hypothetical protein [Thermoleophilia bacterium]
MSVSTTNYYDTFIEVAGDCPAEVSEIPPESRGGKAASIQYELIARHPYRYTSDEVVFHVFAVKNDLPGSALEEERRKFFSKDQPCLRSSPLTKRYGWGVHSDSEGKIALYARESDEHATLANDARLQHLKALRARRA